MCMLVVCCILGLLLCLWLFFFKQKTAYEMRMSDGSSDVCSSDLLIAIAVSLALLVGLLASIGLLPMLGLVLSVPLAVAAFLPLVGRRLTRVPLATWGMGIAHFGIAVALFGMASERAFTRERLAAVEIGGAGWVDDWHIGRGAGRGRGGQVG